MYVAGMISLKIMHSLGSGSVKIQDGHCNRQPPDHHAEKDRFWGGSFLIALEIECCPSSEHIDKQPALITYRTNLGRYQSAPKAKCRSSDEPRLSIAID